MNTYRHGLTVLGATTDRAVLLRVKNIPQVVRAQGGSLGALVQSLAPDAIEQKVYDEMSKQLVTKMREQGVDADVQVVAPQGWKSAGSNPVWMPLAIGLGVTTVGLLAWKLLGGGPRRLPARSW